MQTAIVDAARALVEAIEHAFAAFPGFDVEELSSRGWASATFCGARHQLHFTVEGPGADQAAARFIGGLEAAEFDLPGHIVADIHVQAEERSPGFARIAIEALTVEGC